MAAVDLVHVLRRYARRGRCPGDVIDALLTDLRGFLCLHGSACFQAVVHIFIALGAVVGYLCLGSLMQLLSATPTPQLAQVSAQVGQVGTLASQS